jgi:hypothetical protein
MTGKDDSLAVILFCGNRAYAIPRSINGNSRQGWGEIPLLTWEVAIKLLIWLECEFKRFFKGCNCRN